MHLASEAAPGGGEVAEGGDGGGGDRRDGGHQPGIVGPSDSDLGRTTVAPAHAYRHTGLGLDYESPT